MLSFVQRCAYGRIRVICTYKPYTVSTHHRRDRRTRVRHARKLIALRKIAFTRERWVDWDWPPSKEPRALHEPRARIQKCFSSYLLVLSCAREMSSCVISRVSFFNPLEIREPRILNFYDNPLEGIPRHFVYYIIRRIKKWLQQLISFNVHSSENEICLSRDDEGSKAQIRIEQANSLVVWFKLRCKMYFKVNSI